MIASAAFFHLSLGEHHGMDLDVQPGLSLPLESEIVITKTKSYALGIDLGARRPSLL
ncbi:hypothetical protein KSZ_78410 [Dictyobacter formicarum]|uniref:Uncharacterized protein n=1 Tax=Dictyobacter formicarum TaxID=2778368 RepID=A0ABQ3VVL9_9CHLR|nr:hypothetical protein KSZ_78410 [Dictyobacter formicarum]